MKVSKAEFYSVTPENIDELKEILKIKNLDEFDFLEMNSSLIDDIQEMNFYELINEICDILNKIEWIYDCDSLYYDFDFNSADKFYFSFDFNLLKTEKIKEIKNEEINEIISSFLKNIKQLKNIYKIDIKNLIFHFDSANDKVYIYDLTLSKSDQLKIYFLNKKVIEEEYGFTNFNDFIENIAIDEFFEIMDIDVEEMENEIKNLIKDLFDEFIEFIRNKIFFNDDIDQYLNLLIENNINIKMTKNEYLQLIKNRKNNFLQLKIK